MPLARTFLDWDRPALPMVAEYLRDRYGGETVIDLSGVVVVLTGRRACRRLVEILVQQTDGRLVPPATITEGEFPELLYRPKRPFAPRLVQQLAWAEAVRRLPRPQAESVLQDVPDDGDVDAWKRLGELLWRLHRELAAELLDFSDVLGEGERTPGFNERRRWEALRVAQREYLDLLDGLGLWDKQTARIVAVQERECQTDRDIILVGTVDLNRSTRAMLDQVADCVTALIHAPEWLQERFDEHGCLLPEAWSRHELTLGEEHVRTVEEPLDQADELVRVLAGFGGGYRADEITVGLADERLVPKMQRRLRQYDVASRWGVGKSLPQTALMRLLDATAAYLETGRSDHFATLVRHPDVSAWLVTKSVAPNWLQQLDEYLTEHLQQRLGFWLGRRERCDQVRKVHKLVRDLLADLGGEPRALSEWSPVLRDVLSELYGHRQYDRQVPAEHMELEAITLFQNTLSDYGEIPSALMPVVTGAQALRLTIDQLAGEAVPPPVDPSALELLGWLDLPLDDAPALVVTSFNEQFVPSSVVGDLLLPNRLRRQLGVLDNDRRFARDAYALSAMLASRERVVLISGRRDERGDPLLPSRLLFACDPAQAAERVKAFYESRTPPALPFITPPSPSDADAGFHLPRPTPLVEPLMAIPVTAFRTYLQCPYRFYLRHVLNLDGAVPEVEEMDGRAFGTLIHAALHEFAESDVKNSTVADEIAEFLRSTVDELADRQFGRSRMPAVSVQLEQARRRLDVFARWQAERARDGWTIAFVEEREHGAVEFPIGNGRTVFLKGRIDRIDRHVARDEWALLDYKTEESPRDPDKAHREKGDWVDLQLPLYRHLARELGVEGDVSLGYVTLPRDPGEVRARMAPWSQGDLSDADAKAREIAERILDECFELNESYRPAMGDDFSAICQDTVFDRRLPE